MNTNPTATVAVAVEAPPGLTGSASSRRQPRRIEVRSCRTHPNEAPVLCMGCELLECASCHHKEHPNCHTCVTSKVRDRERYRGFEVHEPQAHKEEA